MLRYNSTSVISVVDKARIVTGSSKFIISGMLTVDFYYAESLFTKPHNFINMRATQLLLSALKRGMNFI